MRNKPKKIKLAIANIKHQPFRYWMTFFIVLVMTVCIFSSSMLIHSMDNGIDVAKNRLGADIIIIPENNEDLTEKALFNGEPCTLKMSYAIFDKIKDLPDITDITSRLYLSTLKGQSCCDSEIQLIATDIQQDFLLKAWITEPDELQENEIILGNNFMNQPGDHVTYYDKDFIVKSILEKTNTGYDNSAFISYAAADQIMMNPKYENYYSKSENTKNTISMIFINTKNLKETRTDIGGILYYDGVELYNADTKLSEYTNSIDNTKLFSNMFDILIVVLSILALSAIHMISTSQRRNEIGSMMTVGFTKCYIRSIFMIESIMIYVSATLCGILIYEIIFGLFSSMISQLFNVPMMNISTQETILIGSLVLLMNLIICIITTFLVDKHVSKTSPSELIKEAS